MNAIFVSFVLCTVLFLFITTMMIMYYSLGEKNRKLTQMLKVAVTDYHKLPAGQYARVSDVVRIEDGKALTCFINQDTHEYFIISFCSAGDTHFGMDAVRFKVLPK